MCLYAERGIVCKCISNLYRSLFIYCPCAFVATVKLDKPLAFIVKIAADILTKMPISHVSEYKTWFKSLRLGILQQTIFWPRGDKTFHAQLSLD